MVDAHTTDRYRGESKPEAASQADSLGGEGEVI